MRNHKYTLLTSFYANDERNVTCAHNDQVNIQYWPGQYSILTQYIVNIDPVRCILTRSLLYIDPVNIEYWPGRWWILTSYFFGITKQLITFHSANMVKWRSLDLVLSVVWTDLGLRPRSGQTTSSTRSRVLHFTMLTSWKVINCIIMTYI